MLFGLPGRIGVVNAETANQGHQPRGGDDHFVPPEEAVVSVLTRVLLVGVDPETANQTDSGKAQP